MQPIIVLSINSSWNILNFRAGLIRRLRQEGFDIVALAPEDQSSGKLVELGIRYVPIAMDNAGSSPLHDLQLLRAYWRVLRRLRPAVFLGWTIKPNIYGSLAAQALGIPVINNVSGLGTAFIREGWLTRVVSRLYQIALRRSSTVFFQNAEDRDLFAARRLVAPGKTRLLPGSGIDLTRFTPDEQARSSDQPFTFLLVARLLRDKGVREYAQAAVLVRARRPTARFLLLGFLDVVNRTAITRAEVDAWSAAGLLEYLGAAEDVRPAMRQADCIVLPSYREGMPRTLLEGAALAKPLIATDVPGCREIAREGVNALLCRVADVRSLAEAMERMLALSDDERQAMGRAGRIIAETEFDERLVGDAYVEAIGAALLS